MDKTQAQSAAIHAKSKALHKVKGGKNTIMLKSGEVIEAGKKYPTKREKPLKSWGDEFGKRGFTK